MTGCTSARRLGLCAVAGTLVDSDRLALEAHLAACAACAAAQGRLRLFDALRAEDVPALASPARARVFAKLAEAAGEVRPGPVRERRLLPMARSAAWAMAAIFALAIVAAWLGLRGGDMRARRIASSPADRIHDVSGPRLLGFGSARVEPSADAVVAWSAGDETLTLSAGRVRISVPEGGRPIRLATDRFVVVALAGIFVATPATVQVEVGWVRIERPAGGEVARIAAGGEWRVAAGAPSASCPTCGALLREAASTLARGRVAESRAIVEGVLASSPSPAQAAEAGLLLADAARIEGRRAEAIRRYRQIARQSRGAAGENALYAAAQMEAESGRREAARDLLREYLTRYPHGRFVRSATDRLGSDR